MSEDLRDRLQLHYEPSRGYVHLAMYIEPGVITSGLCATQRFEYDGVSSYVEEWVARLESVDPNGLHVSFLRSNEAPRLWQDCVYVDRSSPAAIAEDGCLCVKSFSDPLTLMPAVAEHYRTVTGNIETWTYVTYAPVELPPDERLAAIIVDRESDIFWVRTERGHLHFLPEQVGRGYNVGYPGGGPSEFARMIVKLVESDGYGIAAGTSSVSRNDLVTEWACDKQSNQTRELTLAEMRTLCRSGVLY